MEIEILRWIQGFSNPFLDVFFNLVTMLGETGVILFIFALIYWGYNKEFGEYIGFTLFSTLLVNNTLKNIFRAERPIGIEGIKSQRIETATGSSFPSGHSQIAGSLYSGLSIYTGRARIIALVLIILIGLSRLYLGVHYPRDVIAGILFGIIVSIICLKAFNTVKDRNRLYLIIFLIFLPVMIVNPSPDGVKSLGGFLGFLLGTYTEKKFINFENNSVGIKRISRIVIGIALTGTIQILLKIIPLDSLIFSFIRYMIVVFFAVAIYPYIIKKFNL